MADLNINFNISSKNVDLSNLTTNSSTDLNRSMNLEFNSSNSEVTNKFGGTSTSQMETLDLSIKEPSNKIESSNTETVSFEAKELASNSTFNVQQGNQAKTSDRSLNVNLNDKNSSTMTSNRQVELNNTKSINNNSNNQTAINNNQSKQDINIPNTSSTSTTSSMSQTSSTFTSSINNQNTPNASANTLNMKDNIASRDNKDFNQTIDSKQVITLQTKDNNGNIITEEISLDEYRNTLKKSGLTDKDITRIINGEITPTDLFSEIEKDPVRLKQVMIPSYLESLGLDYNNLEELKKATESDKQDLKNLLDQRTKTDNRELDNFYMITARVQMGENFDSVLSTQIVAWMYKDELGNTCYRYDDPYINYVDNEIEYTALTFNEMYPDSKYVEEFRSVLTKYTRKRWFKDEYVTTYIWDGTEEAYAFLDELAKEYGDLTKSRKQALEQLDKQIEAKTEEIQKYEYYYEYINQEIDYYIENINQYTVKEDFYKNCNFDSSNSYILTKIIDSFEGYDYSMGSIPIKSLSDIDEIAAVLSMMVNQDENIYNCFVVDPKTGLNIMLTSTDKDNLVEHFGKWQEFMTEQEREVFNYILNTEGSQKAYDYIFNISHELDNRWLANKTKEDAEYAKEHPVLASIASVVITPFEGISAACYSTAAYFKDSEIYRADVYSVGDVYRGAVAESIESDVGRFVYNTGMSMADTAVLIGIGALTGGAGMPAISAVTMGSRAYVSCLNDCLDRGLTNGQAVALAWTSAVVETAMESYSAGHLLNLEGNLSKGTTSLIKATASKIENPVLSNIATKTLYVAASSISQGLAEGEEEFSTEVLNYICDELIAGDLSNHTTTINSYIDLGYSEEEARKIANKQFESQLGQAFLGGFASGVCFGAIGSLKTNHSVSTNIANEIESEYKGDKVAYLKDKNMQEAEIYAQSYETLRQMQVERENLEKLERKSNLIELERKVKQLYSNQMNSDASLTKSILGTLTSSITTFTKLSSASVEQNQMLLNKITNEGLYHITSLENAQNIMNEGTVNASKPGITSYGKAKSFFFAGTPNLGEVCLNLDTYQEKLVAVKIKESNDTIIKENFKYRVDDDFTIMHDGNFNFNKENAQIVYLGLTVNEQGEFTYKEISKEDYQTYSLNKSQITNEVIKKQVNLLKGIYYGLSYQFNVLTKRVSKLQKLKLDTSSIDTSFKPNIETSSSELSTDAYLLTERFGKIAQDYEMEFMENVDFHVGGSVLKETALKLENLFFDDDYIIGIHRCGTTKATDIIKTGLNLSGDVSSGGVSKEISLNKNIDFFQKQSIFEFSRMLYLMKMSINYKATNTTDCLLIKIPKSKISIDDEDVILNKNSNLLKPNGKYVALDPSCIAGYVTISNKNKTEYGNIEVEGDIGKFIENKQIEQVENSVGESNKLQTKEDLNNLIKSTRKNIKEETIEKLTNEFVAVLNTKGINLEDLKLNAQGESSYVFEYNDQIIKLSTISYQNYDRLTDYVADSQHILRPQDEVTINLGEYNASILFEEKLSWDIITDEDVRDMALSLRKDGYLWYDLKKENIMIDSNRNKLLIDYGELININNMNESQRTAELKNYKKFFPNIDENYKKNLIREATSPKEILENIIRDNNYDYLYANLLEKGYVGKKVFALDFITAIEENPTYINNLTTNQLITLFAVKNNGQNSKIKTFDLIEKEIMARARQGENIFSGNNYNFYKDFKGEIINTFDLTGFSKENLVEIQTMMSNMWQEFKTEYPEISKNLSGKVGYKTFLSFVENMDIMTEEKMNVFNKLLSENRNIGVKSINFKIFDDKIFNIGEDFITLISKYPNIESKVISMKDNETAMNRLRYIVNEYNTKSDYLYKSILESTVNYLNNLSGDEISKLYNGNIIENALRENIKTNKMSNGKTALETLYENDSRLQSSAIDISNKINSFNENNYTKRTETINGNNIKVIEVADAFNMLVYSTDSGIIKSSNSTENIVDSFKNPTNTQQNYVSTSYISDSNFKTANVGDNGYVMGFVNLPASDIRLAYDMDAHTRLSEFNLNSLSDEKSITTKNLDEARRGYTDVAIKRTNPDYIVLFKNATEIQKNNAYEAATKWNIPVIEIDTEKIISNHIEKENILMNSNGNPASIVTDFENLANSLGLNVLENNVKIKEMEQQKANITNYLIEYAKLSEENLSKVRNAIESEIHKYTEANSTISNAVKTQSYLDFNINVLDKISADLRGAEVIDVKTLNMDKPGPFQRSKKINTNLIYERYDTLYRTDASNIEKVLSQIKSQDGRVLIELKDTTDLTTELINKIPDNIDVRISGAYTDEFLQGFKTFDGAINSGKNTIYTKKQLLGIISEIERFEAGINPKWNEYEKALYAYEYIRDNIEYTDDSRRLKEDPSSSVRKQQFESLTSLIAGESTCQGFAFTYQELLNRMGINCVEIGGKNGMQQHAWNVVTIGNDTFIVDTTYESFKSKENGKTGFGLVDYSKYSPKNNQELFSSVNQNSDIIINNISDYNLKAKILKEYKYENFLSLFDPNEPFRDYIFEDIVTKMNTESLKQMSHFIANSLNNGSIDYAKLTIEDKKRLKYLLNDIFLYESDGFYLFIQSDDYSSYKLMNVLDANYIIDIFYYRKNDLNDFLKEISDDTLKEYREILRNIIEREKYHNPDSVKGYRHLKETLYDTFKFAYNIETDNTIIEQLKQTDPDYFYNFIIYEGIDGVKDLINYSNSTDKTVKGVTSFFEKFSSFGVKQNSTSSVSIDILKKYNNLSKIADSYFPGMSNMEKIKLFNLVDSVGACTYATACNIIYTYYKEKPLEFRRDFGYDMYVTENGVTKLNDSALLLDLYCFANKDILITNTSGVWKSERKATNQIYINNRHDILDSFIKSKNDNLSLIEPIKYSSMYIDSSDFDADILRGIIKRYIDDGYQVELSLFNNINEDSKRNEFIFKMQDMTKTEMLNSFLDKGHFNYYGDKRNYSTNSWGRSGHSTMITGIDQNGDIVVCCWGMELKVKIDEIISNGKILLRILGIGENSK